MLHTELLRLLNDHEAWAFVGSGPSVDAGAASWRRLVEIAAEMPEAADVSKDSAFKSAVNNLNYPLAFDYLIEEIGRPDVVKAVEGALQTSQAPGNMHRQLAALPFAGYITTNYDTLLEGALRERGEPWVTVGNTPDEARKVSAGAEHVVWHMHGAAGLPADRSHLVLGQGDYDDIYRSGSEVQEHLKALLIQRRVVFIGFGFNDYAVAALLRRIGAMVSPDRFAYAFIEKRGDFSSELGRSIFLTKHNIDVIPYKVRGESHRQLTDMLEVYSSLTVPRVIRGIEPPHPPADLDPPTLGLMIYNELLLTRGLEIPSAIRGALLESHLLSLVAAGRRPIRDLLENASELAIELGRRVEGAAPADERESTVRAAVAALTSAGLVTVKQEEMELTDNGRELVKTKTAAVELLSDVFRSSLEARTRMLGSTDSREVVTVADRFFRDCMARRALGVAMAVSVGGPGQQEYHAISLLQSLPDYVNAMTSPEAARLLVEIVQGVLRGPTDGEMQYLGTAMQAAFAVHLLGYDVDTFTARHAELQQSAFILDSNTLIPLLAVGSVGHNSARQLVERIRKVGAKLLSTPQLIQEVSEHARWAQGRVRENASHTYLALSVFSAATGRSGQRSNAFLEGFLSRVAAGDDARSVDAYLIRTCGLEMLDRNRLVRDKSVESALRRGGIEVVELGHFAGYTSDMGQRKDGYQAELYAKRVSADTFTRDRQVEAEAEVTVIVEALRSGEVVLPGSPVGLSTRAFFVSHTRIIDEVAQSDLPVVMRPEAALQWLLTLHPTTPDDLASLTTGLLWELQERGQDIVDKETISTAFRPFLDASLKKRDEELLRMQRLEASRYAGAEPVPSNVMPLDVPIVLESQLTQRVAQLETELQQAQAKGGAASGLDEAERAELERLRRKQDGRRRVEKREFRIGRRKQPPSS
jgi:hypothetical protein